MKEQLAKILKISVMPHQTNFFVWGVMKILTVSFNYLKKKVGVSPGVKNNDFFL